MRKLRSKPLQHGLRFDPLRYVDDGAYADPEWTERRRVFGNKVGMPDIVLKSPKLEFRSETVLSPVSCLERPAHNVGRLSPKIGYGPEYLLHAVGLRQLQRTMVCFDNLNRISCLSDKFRMIVD